MKSNSKSFIYQRIIILFGILFVSNSFAKQIKVHFKKPDQWKTSYVHYWNTTPNHLSSQWPGVKMTPEENGWYVFALPEETAINIVFSDNGSPQTIDLQTTLIESWFQDGDFWDINPDFLDQFTFPQARSKALVMSFDDGNFQDIRLIEIFNRYGIKGTFHLNSRLMLENDPRRIPVLKAPSIYYGHEVSSHSETHADLSNLDLTQLYNEVYNDRIQLEQVFHQPVHGMAYPFGTYNSLLLNLLPSWGLNYARVVPITGDFRLPNDLYQWKGSGYQNQSLSLGEKFLKTSINKLSLLFIWGHSWDLDGSDPGNNWSMIENFSKMIGRRSDIWYASAGEVAEYLNALRLTKFNTNGQITNNSQISIWFKDKGNIIEIPPSRLYLAK